MSVVLEYTPLRCNGKTLVSGAIRSGGHGALARAVFIYGFAKNTRDNIDDDELQTMRDVAAGLLACDDAALDRAKATDELQEIENGNQDAK